MFGLELDELVPTTQARARPGSALSKIWHDFHQGKIASFAFVLRLGGICRPVDSAVDFVREPSVVNIYCEYSDDKNSAGPEDCDEFTEQTLPRGNSDNAIAPNPRIAT